MKITNVAFSLTDNNREDEKMYNLQIPCTHQIPFFIELLIFFCFSWLNFPSPFLFPINIFIAIIKEIVYIYTHTNIHTIDGLIFNKQQYKFLYSPRRRSIEKSMYLYTFLYLICYDKNTPEITRKHIPSVGNMTLTQPCVANRQSMAHNDGTMLWFHLEK